MISRFLLIKTLFSKADKKEQTGSLIHLLLADLCT